MHMADSLISPTVGGTFWIISGGLLAFCAKRLGHALKENLIPLMGVLGAFIFAAQMLNFTIPYTGSSGHLGGGLILTVLLGPYAAFIVMASILTVQALFFADGGLLALGCNIFNLGFFPAFVAYPLIYRPLVKGRHTGGRAWAAAVAAAVAGLTLGAFCVVLQTTASGISSLPFGTFLVLMLPIHVAIGIVEGIATAAVVSFIAKARPEAVAAGAENTVALPMLKPVLAALAVAALVLGGAASWFASTHPDGLEWSIAKVSGEEEVSGAPSGAHRLTAAIQEKTAFLPDYGFKARAAEATPAETKTEDEKEPWPAISAGTSISGIVGGAITIVLVAVIGFAVKRMAQPTAR